MSAPKTVVSENARLELLRALAHWRDCIPLLTEQSPDIDWSKPQPLGAGYLNPKNACGTEDAEVFHNQWEDIVLAAKECEALGQITVARPNQNDPFDGHAGWWLVRITDAGYDWIKAHDALGESEQEPR